MNEDFVTFELSIKLKEKGFNDKCFYHWNNGELLCNTCNSESRVTTTDLLMSCNYLVAQFNVEHDNVVCDAPTIAQVLKWLRKEKNIHIEIRIFTIGYGFDIYTINPTNKVAWSRTIEYKTYEEAAISGIKHVLSNIIRL